MPLHRRRFVTLSSLAVPALTLSSLSAARAQTAAQTTGTLEQQSVALMRRGKVVFTAALLVVLASGQRVVRAADTDRRPLLIVDPQHIATDLPGAASGTETATVTVGSLRVVAPKRRQADPRPWLPEDFDRAELPLAEKLICLFSTLNASQWKKLGTAPGLGADDLSGEARTLFLTLLPDPVVPHGGPVAVPAEDIDRRTLRLRLQLGISGLSVFGPNGEEKRGDYPRKPVTEPAPVAYLPDARGAAQTRVLRRAPLPDVPNRPKPSDLDYRRADLRRAVSLDGATTVGDLVKRLGAASGIELYADSRFAPIPVTVTRRGGIVRAGDLARSLALGVRGAWRRIDSASFLLAPDRTGAAALRQRLQDLVRDENARAFDRREEWLRQIRRERGFRRFIGYDPGDPFSPDAKMAAAIVRGTDRDNPAYFSVLAPTDLSAPVRDFWASATAGAETKGGDLRKIYARRTIVAWFETPRGTRLFREYAPDLDLGPPGRFEQEPMSPGEREAARRRRQPGPEPKEPPVSGLLTIPRRESSVFLTANSPADAETAAELARRYGFARVVLQTDRADVAAAGVRAAKRTGIAVAVATGHVTVPASPAISPDSLPRNVFGETRDEEMASKRAPYRRKSFEPWEAPDDRAEARSKNRDSPAAALVAVAPGTPEADSRSRRILALASVPGLTGILIDDRWGDERPYRRGGTFAYGATFRKAFIRAEGIDPLDLVPDVLPSFYRLGSYFQAEDNLPRTPDAYGRWGVFASAFRRRATDDLRESIERVHPALPVWEVAADVFRYRYSGSYPEIQYVPLVAPSVAARPLFHADYRYRFTLHPDFINTISVTKPPSAEAARRQTARLREAIAANAADPPLDDEKLNLDFRSVPLRDAAALMAKWFAAAR